MNRRRTTVSLFLALALALAAGAGLVAGSGRAPEAQQAAGPVQLTGFFNIVWGDPEDGNGAPQMLYTLTTAGGDRVPLSLADEVAAPAGGVLALNRRQVTVEGYRPPAMPGPLAGPQVIDVYSIALVVGAKAAEGAEPAVLGSKPWISILCKFSGLAAEPKNLAFFQGMYGSTKPGLNHYWLEQSFNLANVAGSGAVAWVTLPGTEATYNPSNTAGGTDLDLLATDCLAAADPYVNFSTYIGINMMFNSDFDHGWAWGGTGYFTLDGVSKVWSITWEPPWAYSDISVIAHEMGHGFGLPHSSGNYGATYDNPWDVMSWDRYNCTDDPVYGCVPQHTISYHKDLAGWLTGHRVDVPVGTQTTATLDNLAINSAGSQWVKAPIGATTNYYTFEARKRVGYDSKLLGDAVIVHRVDPARSAPAHIYDKDNNGNNADAGTMFLVGQSFTDVTNHITMTVNAATANGFTITVNNNAIVPTANLLWRQAGTGQNALWYVNGSTLLSTAPVLTVADSTWEIAARGDFNADGQSDIVWRNLATGQNAVWFMNGATYLSSAALLTVADPAWHLVAATDINGDTRPDLIWHHAATGQNAVWYMNGTTCVTTASLPTSVDPLWQMVGAADINGDSHPDLVWRHLSTGQNGVWYMDGVTKIGDAAMMAVPDIAWYIGAVVDVNADGHPDLVWHNAATAANAVWLMNGAAWVSTGTLLTSSDLTWDLAGHRARPVPVTAPSDFNRDGQVDLLWRHAVSGANAIWYMNGTTVASTAFMPTIADVNWQLVGSADLNRDGLADLIWRHQTTGVHVVWYVNGATASWPALLPYVSDINWVLSAVADFNGDGRPDLVWRNVSTGLDAILFMSGPTLVGGAALTTVTDTNWRIVAAADFNGDGKPDLVWRHKVTGQNAVWYMDGATKTGDALLPTVADMNWQVGIAADFNADGKTDLVWRNYATGENAVWLMNGATWVSSVGIMSNPDLNWLLLRR